MREDKEVASIFNILFEIVKFGGSEPVLGSRDDK
jgi:hypothetical protein